MTTSLRLDRRRFAEIFGISVLLSTQTLQASEGIASDLRQLLSEQEIRSLPTKWTKLENETYFSYKREVKFNGEWRFAGYVLPIGKATNQAVKPRKNFIDPRVVPQEIRGFVVTVGASEDDSDVQDFRPPSYLPDDVLPRTPRLAAKQVDSKPQRKATQPMATDSRHSLRWCRTDHVLGSPGPAPQARAEAHLRFDQQRTRDATFSRALRILGSYPDHNALYLSCLKVNSNWGALGDYPFSLPTSRLYQYTARSNSASVRAPMRVTCFGAVSPELGPGFHEDCIEAISLRR